jgi:hypothetical protein
MRSLTNRFSSSSDSQTSITRQPPFGFGPAMSKDASGSVLHAEPLSHSVVELLRAPFGVVDHHRDRDALVLRAASCPDAAP